MDQALTTAMERVRARRASVRGFQGSFAELAALYLNGLPASPADLVPEIKHTALAVMKAGGIRPEPKIAQPLVIGLSEAVLLGYYLAQD